MKPTPIVQLQALANTLAVFIVLIVLQGEGALAAAIDLTVGSLIWTTFAVRYELRVRRRAPALPPLSDRRRAGDRAMRRCFLGGLLLPAAAAWAAYVLALELFRPPLHDAQATLVALVATLTVMAVLVSSSVDWYLIRPFREGVFGDPVCQPSVDPSTKEIYQRYWAAHRFVSELVVFISIAALIALLTAYADAATSSESNGAFLQVLGQVGIIAWTFTQAGRLQGAIGFVRYPSDGGLGVWVTGRNRKAGDIAGLVLDVALDPGVQLIDQPRGHPATDVSNADSSIPLELRDSIRKSAPPRPICPGRVCEFWVPYCELGMHQHGDGPFP